MPKTEKRFKVFQKIFLDRLDIACLPGFANICLKENRK